MELKNNHLPMIRIGLNGEFALGQWDMGECWHSGQIIPSLHALEELRMNPFKKQCGLEKEDNYYNPPTLIHTTQYTVEFIEGALQRDNKVELASIHETLQSALLGKQYNQTCADQTKVTRYVKSPQTVIASLGTNEIRKGVDHPFVYSISRSDQARNATAQGFDPIDMLIGAIFYKGGGV